jgi:hypothetical protein
MIHWQVYLEKTGHRQKFIETSRKVGALKERLQSIKFKTGAHRGSKPSKWSMVAQYLPVSGIGPALNRSLQHRR